MNIREKLEALGFTQDKVKLESNIYNKQTNTCDLCFVYAEWFKLDEQQKQQIVDVCKQELENECNVNVKFKGAYVDNEILYNVFVKFLEKHYKALISVFVADKVQFNKNDKDISIVLSCDNVTADMIKSGTFIAELTQYMNLECFYNFNVELNITQNCDVSVLKQQPKLSGYSLSWALEQEKNLNKLQVANIDYLLGKPIEEQPEFINTAKEKDGQSMIVCGVVSEFTETSYKKKAKEEGAEPTDAVRFTFNLTDASGTIRAVSFPNEKDTEKMRLISDGVSLVVMGNVSNYNDQLSLRVRAVSKCDIVLNELHYCYRGVNEKYNFVSPKPWVEVSQMDLFSLTSSNISDYLKNNTIVMFDLETTGLDPERCAITEIGAVKIKEGKCVETFQTLVNPLTPIPQEVVEKTNITDEMVKSAPTLDQVLPDFYKFVDGCILSAYNIGFDYSFLKILGHKLRYKFDNQRIDCLDVVRQKVPSLTNYKLGTVSKALNVELKNAHRALADALAAAKVFIKLM